MGKTAQLLLVEGCRNVLGLVRSTLGYSSGRCRFTPTCSQYALQACRELAPWIAVPKIIWRVARCSPLSRGGYDPVTRSR